MGRCARIVVAVSLVVAVALAAGACGSSGTKHESTGAVGVKALGSGVSRVSSTADPHLAGDPLGTFGTDLLAKVRARAAPGVNVVVSPLSVAVALGMLEPGVTGDVRARLDALLGSSDAGRYRDALNALVQSLESRRAEALDAGEKPGEILVRVANAAYLQQGYPFEQAYVDTVVRAFGPALYEVDFRPDPDAVAHAVNRFVADATKDRIKDILRDGVLKPDDVFALVNALYLKASWLQPFDSKQTADRDFTRRDGSKVRVPMMQGSSDRSARGDGWIAAEKAYVGELAIELVLPEEGRFDEVAAHLGDVVDQLEHRGTAGAELGLPRLETSFGVELQNAFDALGIGGLFQEGNLRGIADDPRLKLDVATHRTFLAIDERGTEAAAATVLVGRATSAPALSPVPVVLDRPFLFRIVDERTGATLFVGAIDDPTRKA